mgnify:CR=1 FL=1
MRRTVGYAMANIPTNPQAERAVLGACLVSSEALGTVSEMPEDFHDVNNKAVYEICLSMYLENKPIDLVTFQNEAMKRGVFERIGGQPFLAELICYDMLPANAGYYAEIVRDTALRRLMIEAGQKISALGMKADVEANELIGEAEKVILDASASKEASGPVSIQAAAQSTLAKIMELRSGARKNTGFMTNFTDLDRLVNGFQPGTLNIIAARPSMEKTALALNIAQFGHNEHTSPREATVKAPKKE